MKNEPKDKIKHRSLYQLIFYKRKTIEEYINSLNSDAYSTKIKKRNILINLLFQMRTGIIKKKKCAKNYEKVDILPGLNKKELSLIVDKIFSSHNVNLIIIYQLIFELGLTLKQVLYIKVMHIKKDYHHILLKINKKQIYKTLSFYSATLLKYYITKNYLKRNDYIITEKKNYKQKKNYEFWLSKFENLIDRVKDIHANNKSVFLLLLVNEHSRFKINEIFSKTKSNFFKVIWNNLNNYIYEEEKKLKNKIEFHESSKHEENNENLFNYDKNACVEFSPFTENNENEIYTKNELKFNYSIDEKSKDNLFIYNKPYCEELSFYCEDNKDLLDKENKSFLDLFMEQ